MGKILKKRICLGVDNKLRVEQAGFSVGRGSTEQIFVLRNILEQAIEWNSNLYLCFVVFHLMPVLLFAVVVFLIIQSIARRNKKPDMLHPCLTPDLTLNHSVIPDPSTTAHSLSSYMDLVIIISFSGIP
jgi:hypothetical protein